MAATAPCCCVTITIVNWCARKSVPSHRWKPCSAHIAACSKTFSAATSSTSVTPHRPCRPIPTRSSMPRSANLPRLLRVQRAGAAVGSPAASANSPRLYCRRPPNMPPNLVAPKSIPNTCCWRSPTATWSRPPWGSSRSRSMISSGRSNPKPSAARSRSRAKSACRPGSRTRSAALSWPPTNSATLMSGRSIS